jgi:hypothetical protein
VRHGRCDCDCIPIQSLRALARKNQHRPILIAGTSPRRASRIKVFGCMPPNSRAASSTFNRGSKSGVVIKSAVGKNQSIVTTSASSQPDHGSARRSGLVSPCGTDNLCQLASVLPLCLMNFGESVSPGRTNCFRKRVHSVRFSLTCRLYGGAA